QLLGFVSTIKLDGLVGVEAESLLSLQPYNAKIVSAQVIVILYFFCILFSFYFCNKYPFTHFSNEVLLLNFSALFLIILLCIHPPLIFITQNILITLSIELLHFLS